MLRRHAKRDPVHAPFRGVAAERQFGIVYVNREIGEIVDQHMHRDLEIEPGCERQFERRLGERSGPAMTAALSRFAGIPVRTGDRAGHCEGDGFGDRAVDAARQQGMPGRVAADSRAFGEARLDRFVERDIDRVALADRRERFRGDRVQTAPAALGVEIALGQRLRRMQPQFERQPQHVFLKILDEADKAKPLEALLRHRQIGRHGERVGVGFEAGHLVAAQPGQDALAGDVVAQQRRLHVAAQFHDVFVTHELVEAAPGGEPVANRGEARIAAHVL